MERERNGDGLVMAPIAYEFGDFRVDLRTMSLSRQGEIVPLEPKVFDVLCRLIEHRDRVLTKEELLDLAWPDTFVTPNALTRAVAQLRKALGDEAGEAKLIATMSKRGYRWVAPVTVIDSAPAVQTAVSAPVIAVEPAGPAAPASSDTPAIPGAPIVAQRSYTWPLAGALAVAVALVAIGWTWNRGAVSEPLRAELTPTRLTVRNGYDGTPALSADGRIAYTSDVSGSLEIWITGSTPGSRATPLTNDGGQNMEPAWSPDGRWVAFRSVRRGGIWVVPATGGAPRQVAEFGSEPAWSPDSERIVFSSSAGGMAAQSVLMIVSRDGTDLRELTRIGAPPGGHREPSFTPDGQHVAFAVFDGGWVQELWIARLSDGALVKAPTQHSARGPQFDARGERLYWMSRGELWRSSLDRGTLQWRGTPERVLKVDNGYLEDWSMTPSGQIAYSVIADDANLWVVDTRTPDPEPRRLTDQEVRITYPAIGPDGRVVFAQLIPDQGVSAWLTDLQGSTPEHLIDKVSRGVPQWSRDGGRILLRRGAAQAGTFGWLDLATRRFTELAFPADGVSNAALSPDNREIAYHRLATDGPSKGSLNVFVRPIDGGAETQLSFDREAVSYPVWSPDGTSLAVEVKRGSRTHVGVISRRGGTVRLLTQDEGQSFVSSWSADGDWIIFAGERGGVWNVLGVSPRAGQRREFTRFKSATGYVRYPVISRDGAHIVFERDILGGNLWTAEVR